MGAKGSKGDQNHNSGNADELTIEQIREKRAKIFENSARVPEEDKLNEPTNESNPVQQRKEPTRPKEESPVYQQPPQPEKKLKSADAPDDRHDTLSPTPSRQLPEVAVSSQIAYHQEPTKMAPVLDQKQWVHLALCELFGVAIDPLSKEHLPDAYYYRDIQEVVVECGHADGLLKSGNIDSALYHVLSFENKELFRSEDLKMNYLATVYERICLKISEGGSTTPLTIDELREIERVVVNYIGSLLNTPSAFNLNDAKFTPENPKDMSSITNTLFDRFYESIQQLPSDCQSSLIRVLAEGSNSDDLEGVMSGLFKRMIIGCQNASLQSFKGIECALALLQILISYPRIKEIFLNHPIFFDATLYQNCQMLIRFNIFCAALNISALPDESTVAQEHFQSLDKRQIDIATKLLREKLTAVIDSVYSLVKELCKKDWSRVSDLLQHILLLNKDREKSFFNPLERMHLLKTDGFFLNFCKLLLLLCDPFCASIDAMGSKLSRFNILQTFKCVFLKNANQITEAPENSHPIDKSKAGGDSHFMTQIYFITLHALHQAFGLYKKYLEFMKKLSDIQRAGGDLQNNTEFRRLASMKFAFDVQMLDKRMLAIQIRLMSFTCVYALWLNNFQAPTDIIFSNGEQSISLQKEQPITAEYALLPMYAAEDISEYLLLHRQVNPPMLEENRDQLNVIIPMILVWIKQKKWLNNPHARAHMMTFLFSLLPREGEAGQDSLHALFNPVAGIPYLIANIIPSAMSFFIDIEKTGSHNQFYEKFQYRYQVIEVFRYLTNESKQHGEVYMGLFIQYIEQNPDEFIRLINLMLNDLIFLLDEILTKLKKIKQHQLKLALPADHQPPPFANLIERQEAIQHNMQDIQLVKAFWPSLRGSYDVLHRMTLITQRPFLTQEIREKMVANLNYTVAQLNGPTALEYKVSNMKELGVDPRYMMNCVIGIYTHFLKHDEFLVEIVEDTRSFDLELFKETGTKLEQKEVVAADELVGFKRLFDELEIKLKEKKERDEYLKNLGDIPDEFLDPLTTEIMKDPVMLPSKNVLDRISILKHLLSDPSDPFTRKPMSKEDLVPQPKLKARIEEFLASKLPKKK